jgi:hypothetical protein
MKSVDELRRQIQRQGFTVKLVRGGHYHVFNPEGKYVSTMAYSPSCPRSLKNTLAALRRAGLVWPPPSKGQR